MVAFCVRQRANTYVVLENPGLAQQISDATGAIVISRDNYPDDTNNEPANLVAEWIKRNVQWPDIYHYWPNEPGGDLDALLATMVHIIAECKAAGMNKACLGNFAWAKTLFSADVQSGRWDEFLKAASDWTNNDGGLIGGHDYTFGALPWGCDGWNETEMLAGSLRGPDQWPTWHDIYLKGSDNWLLFRWDMLAQRAVELKIPFPRMVLTECFWDRMPNLEQSGLIPQLDSQFNGGTKMHGLLSQRKVMQHLWPAWSPQQAVVEQLQWCENVYPEHVVGFCLFAVNREAHWTDYNLLDYGGGGNGWTDLLNALPANQGRWTMYASNLSRLSGKPVICRDTNYRQTGRLGRVIAELVCTHTGKVITDIRMLGKLLIVGEPNEQ